MASSTAAPTGPPDPPASGPPASAVPAASALGHPQGAARSLTPLVPGPCSPVNVDHPGCLQLPLRTEPCQRPLKYTALVSTRERNRRPPGPCGRGAAVATQGAKGACK